MGPRVMADVELLPLPDELRYRCGCYGYTGQAEHDATVANYARACVAHATAAKDAENERLRAEVDKRQALCEALTAALSSAENSIERIRFLESARAERLAEALREAAGELASIGDSIGHDHPEARRIFTLRANLISARFAALPQEDRNG